MSESDDLTVEAKVTLTAEQAAALRERHGLGPEEDLGPYLADTLRAAVERAIPQAEVIDAAQVD